MKSEDRANVLLVDDKAENLLALESVLEGLGQNLVGATSAREALRHLLLKDFALIILDVQMPGVSGFELAELIRGRERTQHTPIIFVTAESLNDQFVFKGYSLGAVDYITKPFEPEIFKSKVTFFTKLFLQNQQIKRQSELLEQANARLDALNGDLEQRVQRRTEELKTINHELESEIAFRRVLDARLATEHAITRALAASADFESAIPAVLRALCEHMEADVSAFWMLNAEKKTLSCFHIEMGANTPALDAFVAESLTREYEIGIGLPGHVWETGEPISIADSFVGSRFPETTSATAAGLRNFTAFPVKADDEFLGVVEFEGHVPMNVDPAFLAALEAIGSEIGQFVEKKRTEQERENLLTREKTLREQAEMASRLKDEFLATVSHELRTPLNSILGWGQILNSGGLTKEEQTNALETIYRNAKSQAQLIDDLLDTSRLITGNLLLNLGPTNVIATVQTAIDVVRPSAEAKHIKITSSIDSPVSTVTCDSQRLQQMVWNLLTNAVKFTQKDGHIDVRITHGPNDLKIAVTDDGHGIAPEFLPYVFDRFRQEDSSSTRRHEGLGLGLAIVRHLAELHGGKTTAESDGLGKGSTFTLSIPASQMDLAPETFRDAPPVEVLPDIAVRTGLDNVRILIVDDDRDACDMLAFGLGMLGAEVRTCRSANEALDQIDECRPHILLTDLNMPGEDGYSLVKRLRNRPLKNGADIPAIALTAMARPEDSERTLSAGFQLHVAKPVEISELSEAIVQLVGR